MIGGVFSVILMCSGIVHLFCENNDRLDDCLRELDAYYMYYRSTETLLDSAGVDVDSPLLETDAGSMYLDTKMHLDSIYSMNHYGISLTKKVIDDNRVK